MYVDISHFYQKSAKEELNIKLGEIYRRTFEAKLTAKAIMSVERRAFGHETLS